jgi:hypothetical protein
MHVAQGCRKALDNKLCDRAMQVFISGGIAGGGRVAVIDPPAWAGEPYLFHFTERRSSPLFDNFECFSVDYPDFIKRMNLVVGREQRSVSDKAYTFNLSATAAEIRFRFGDDDISVDPLRRDLCLDELPEWIVSYSLAADRLDTARCNADAASFCKLKHGAFNARIDDQAALRQGRPESLMTSVEEV